MMYIVYAILPGEPKLALKDETGNAFYFDGFRNELRKMFPLFVEAAIAKYYYLPIEKPFQVTQEQLLGVAQNLMNRSI